MQTGSAEWPQFAPQTELGSGALGEAQAADREMARLYARRARALAAFADARPASADRAQGEPGAMSAERWSVRPEVLRPVSEWATPEAAIGLTRSQGRAQGLLEESCTLVTALPGALAALEGGLLTPEHLRPLLEHVAPIPDPRLRAEIEADVLRWVAARAARKTITVPAQVGERVLRVVTRRNVRHAAQRALRALRERGVFRQAERGVGLAGLGVVGTVPEIEALHAALSAYVDALPAEPGDTRSRAQKMLDVLLDLVLRPGQHDLPPVQVVLTLVAAVSTALGGDAPAELNGRVVSAETARQLLNRLTGAGLGEASLSELRHLAADEPAADEPAADEPAADEPAADEPAADVDADDVDADDVDADDVDADSAPAADLVPAAPGGDEPLRADWAVPEEEMSPRMRAALAEWEAELERRLAAGQLDDPDPMPEEGWLASVAERLAGDAFDPEFDPEFDRALAAAQERWEADLEAGRIADPDPPDARSAPPGTAPGSARAPGSGWWAAADRALAEASAAQWEAERAVARAGRLVRTAAHADTADETTWRRSAAGRVDAAEDAISALLAAGRADRAALHDLLARTDGGGLAERPRLALVDALSGALVSLTDLPGLRRAAHCGRPACRRRPERCAHDLTGRPGLGAPPPTDGYRPGAALDRFLRLRDRCCRWPGCRRPVCRGELDHRVRWPDGPTDVTNLAGLCTGDHRGKHQAPGVHVDLTDQGTLVVTTPSGITATTDPPPF